MFPRPPMRREGVCGGFTCRLATAFALLISLPAAPASALDPRKAITQYIHDIWQTGQGLPQNSIYAICQTRDGYLWFGTQEGLVRFDGVRFVVFDTRSTPELRHNFIRALCEDREGNLWIGTRGGGLSRYRDGIFTSFTREKGLSSDLVLSLFKGREGSLWIGTDGGGLNRFKDGRFTSFTTKQGLPTDVIIELYEDREGSLWLGTYGGGLSRFSDGKFTSISTGVSSGFIGALCEDRAGSLWVGTYGDGLRRLRDGQFSGYTTKDGLSNDRITSLYQDREGSLWIGTAEGGLNRFRDGTFTSFTTNEGLSHNAVLSFYEDTEGSLWIGTDGGGLNRFRDGKFTSITTKEGLCNDYVVSFSENRDGSLWIGTLGGGLSCLRDGKFTSFTTKQGLSSDQVTSLYEDHEGNLWAGTYGGGLNRFSDGKFKAYSMKDGLSDDKVLALYQDRERSLWIGTEAGGLSRFRDGKFIAFPMGQALSDHEVNSICEDQEGSLWIGTAGGGLDRLTDGKLTAYSTKEGLSSEQVVSLYADRDGSLWIGTLGGGLNRYRGGKLTHFTTKDGFFDDLVQQILEDDQGNLWMTCNKGIFRASMKDLNEFAEGKVQRISCVSYGIADGMKSAECNGGSQPSCLKTRDGRLWFPTIAGAVVIDPAHMPINRLPPPVVLEDLLVDKKQLIRATAGSQIVLPPGKGNLEFHYTALSFLVPQRVKFKYRLEGFDEDWVDAGTERTAHYTNLPPRKYTFRVIACNDDGVWNEGGASLTFRLKPHFYQTMWFYALVVMTLIAAMHTLYRYRVRRVLELERVRTRIATDLHDEVGAGLTHIAMISETIHGRLSGSHAETAGLASTAAGTARELVDSLTDVVWAIDPKLDDLQSLIARIRKFSSEFLEAKGISFEMISPDELPRVHVGSDHRRQILLIVKEAVNNIAKYASCSEVLIILDWRARSIDGEIRDNGLGFDTDHVVPRGSGRGLASMRERAERLGGSLTVTSEPGKGTRIAFTIPLKPHEHAMPGARDKH